MAIVKLQYKAELSKIDPAQHAVLIVGQMHHLHKLSYDKVKVKLEPRVSHDVYNSAIKNLQPSPTDSCSLYLNNATVASLPIKCTRHNAPSRSHSLTRIVRSCMNGGDEFIVLVCEKTELVASVCAITRAFPLFTRKSSAGFSKRIVTVEVILMGTDTTLSEDDLSCLEEVSYSIQLACRITDMPCSEMNTDAFVQEIRDVGKLLEIEPTVISGEDLKTQGFGGLYGVGKAAVHPPALVILSHKPEGAKKNIAWVGKGIVYDTGGLSIKSKAAMPGMKRDCGGAAAVLGAFYSAVKQGFKENLHAIFCLAENAVGANSLRPDDIITLYSGRTIEVNNTDAEGRLVLGDGVSYASKHLHAQIIVDLATLTGAQGSATGRYHGAVLTNKADWESVCVTAGRNSGDLVYPVVYCPELHFGEFASAVADMKNSSADRSNAEVSCAGLFIGAQLSFDFPGIWIHLDMAYPVYMGERATGYGVGFLLALFADATKADLIQKMLPKEAVLDGVISNEENASKKMKLY